MARALSALTIGPSDPTGAGSVEADLKTFSALGLHGSAVLTAIADHGLPDAQVLAQIEAVFTAIRCDTVKLQVPPNAGLIEAIASALRRHDAGLLVLDPDGVRGEFALVALRDSLLRLSRVVVPSIDEAAALSGMPVSTWEEMREAARAIAGMGAGAVVIKGGKRARELATDLLFDGKDFRDYSAERVEGPSIRGAGTTFAAAIAATLAKGEPIEHAVAAAKAYVTKALQGAYELGDGRALHHFYRYWQPRG